MVSRSSHRTIGRFSTVAGVATTGLCADSDGFTVDADGGGANVTLVGILRGFSATATLAVASWREGTMAAAADAEAPETRLPK